MAEVVLEHARPSHLLLAAEQMRADDRAEVLASGGYTPLAALQASVEASVLVRVALIDGELAAVFGVALVGNGATAVPWALTTGAVERHPMAFWRASKFIVAELLRFFPVLEQQVDARYTRALSWVRRLGFTVHPAAPFGAAALPFHRITRGA